MVLTLCIFSDHALYFYQVSQKDLLKILDYKVDMISILKFTKGHNSIKMWIESWYLISAHLLMTTYICINFH